jgi:hypothetical protein
MFHPVRGPVPHAQVGYGSLFRRFNDPAVQASSHFWISKTGVIEQYVDTDVKAWAEGDGNPNFWSIEFEGMTGEPLTPEQITAGGRLCAWLHAIDPFPLVVNTDPFQSGYTPHFAGGRSWGGHTCPLPGPRFDQFADLIEATRQQLGGAAPAPATDQEDDDMPKITLVQCPKDPRGAEYGSIVYKTDGFSRFTVADHDGANGLPGPDSEHYQYLVSVYGPVQIIDPQQLNMLRDDDTLLAAAAKILTS